MLSRSACECGTSSCVVRGKPLFRAICHCSICQTFNQAAFADVTLFRPNDVALTNETSVKFTSYTSPTIVERGRCRTCNAPAIEYLRVPFVPNLIFIPTKNIQTQLNIPAPSLHIFYDKRVADISDNIAKHEGYLRSQYAFCRQVFKALISR